MCGGYAPQNTPCTTDTHALPPNPATKAHMRTFAARTSPQHRTPKPQLQHIYRLFQLTGLAAPQSAPSAQLPSTLQSPQPPSPVRPSLIPPFTQLILDVFNFLSMLTPGQMDQGCYKETMILVSLVDGRGHNNGVLDTPISLIRESGKHDVPCGK